MISPGLGVHLIDSNVLLYAQDKHDSSKYRIARVPAQPATASLYPTNSVQGQLLRLLVEIDEFGIETAFATATE